MPKSLLNLTWAWLILAGIFKSPNEFCLCNPPSPPLPLANVNLVVSPPALTVVNRPNDTDFWDCKGDFPGDSLLGDRDGKGSEPLSDDIGVKNAKDEVGGVKSNISNCNPSITLLNVYALDRLCIWLVIVVLGAEGRYSSNRRQERWFSHCNCWGSQLGRGFENSSVPSLEWTEKRCLLLLEI